MSTDELVPSVGQIVGQNLSRLRERERLTQADLTKRIFDRTGERWTRAQLSTLENGKRESITLEELLVLAHTFGVRLADLFDSGVIVVAAGDEDLARNFLVNAGDFLVTLEGIRAALEGGPVRAFARPDTARKVKTWLASQVEADKAVAERLGLDVKTVVDAAVTMWGHTLTEERDARLGDTGELPPRTLQAKRGAMTRVLTGQIEAHLRAK